MEPERPIEIDENTRQLMRKSELDLSCYIIEALKKHDGQWVRFPTLITQKLASDLRWSGLLQRRNVLPKGHSTRWASMAFVATPAALHLTSEQIRDALHTYLTADEESESA